MKKHLYTLLILLLAFVAIGCDTEPVLKSFVASEAPIPQRYPAGDILLNTTTDFQENFAMSGTEIFHSNRSGTQFQVFNHKGAYLREFTRNRVALRTQFSLEKGERSDDWLIGMWYVEPNLYMKVLASPAPTFTGTYLYVFSTDGEQIDFRQMKDPRIGGNSWYKKHLFPVIIIQAGDILETTYEHHSPLFAWQGVFYGYNRERLVYQHEEGYLDFKDTRWFYQQIDSDYQLTEVGDVNLEYGTPIGERVPMVSATEMHAPDNHHILRDSSVQRGYHATFDYDRGIIYRGAGYYTLAAFSINDGSFLYPVIVDVNGGQWAYANDALYMFTEHARTLKCFRY